jgi:hypothetical protein
LRFWLWIVEPTTARRVAGPTAQWQSLRLTKDRLSIKACSDVVQLLLQILARSSVEQFRKRGCFAELKNMEQLMLQVT